MTIKEALIQYPTILEQIKQIQRGICTMTETRHDTQITPGMSGMPGGGCISNPTMNQVMDVDDRIRRNIESSLKEINELLDAKVAVDRGLKLLSVPERKVIEVKYFEGVREWATIAKILYYSKIHCKRLHKSAIESMHGIMIRNDTK